MKGIKQIYITEKQTTIEKKLLFEILEFLNDSNIANTFMKTKSSELAEKLKIFLEGGNYDCTISEIEKRAERN